MSSTSPASIVRRPSQNTVPGRFKFVASGTAKQQTAWALQIDRRIEREIRWTNARAAQLERLRSRLSARTATGRPPTTELLCKLFDAVHSARYYIFKLIGEPPQRDRNGLLSRIFPRSAVIVAVTPPATPEPEPAPATKTAAAPTLPLDRTVAAQYTLGGDDTIALPSQPISELERRVRSRWMDRACEEPKTIQHEPTVDDLLDRSRELLASYSTPRQTPVVPIVSDPLRLDLIASRAQQHRLQASARARQAADNAHQSLPDPVEGAKVVPIVSDPLTLALIACRADAIELRAAESLRSPDSARSALLPKAEKLAAEAIRKCERGSATRYLANSLDLRG